MRRYSPFVGNEPRQASLNLQSPLARGILAAGITPLDPINSRYATAAASGQTLPTRASLRNANTARFNGTTDVVQVTGAAAQAQAPVTMMAVFTPSTVSGTAQYGVLSVGQPTDTSGVAIRFDGTISGGTLEMDSPSASAVFTGCTIAAGTRYAVVMSVSSMTGIPTAYVNGVKYTGSGAIGGTNTNHSNVYIGAESGAGGMQFPFAGDIEAWAVWNRKLDDDELFRLSINPYLIFGSASQIVSPIRKPAAAAPTGLATVSKTGTFSCNLSTGNQSITGLGFQPKAVLFWAFTTASVSGSNELRHSFGVATGATERWSNGSSWLGGTSGFSNFQFLTNRVIHWNDTTTDAEQIGIDFVSMDADGFTVNVAKAPSGTTEISYMAIGGTSVTAKAGTFNTTNTTGNLAVTTGFQPKAVVTFAGPYTNVDTRLTVAAHCVGMSAGTSNSACLTHHLAYGSGSQAWSKNSSTRDLIHTINQNGDFEVRATLASFDATGFTMNFLSATATTSRWGYLALGGAASYDLSVYNIPSAIGSVSKTGLGWTPAGAFSMSLGIPAGTTQAANVKWSLGSSDGINNVTSGFYEPNASFQTNLPVVTNLGTKATMVPGTSSGSTLARATIGSFTNGGYTMPFDQVDSSNGEVMVLSFGSPQAAALVAPVSTKTTVTAALTNAIRLASNVGGKTTISAALTALGASLISAVGGKTTITASLTTNNAAIQVSAKTTLTAALTNAIRLAANLGGKTTVNANLTINPVGWYSEVHGKSTVTADLNSSIYLDADVGAKTTLSAALTTTQRLSAAISMKSTVSATLRAPSDLISVLPFSTWLEDVSANPVVLVEVTVNTGGSETTRYLSSKIYTTNQYDGPVNTAYEPVVMGGIKVNEALTVDGTASMSWGDIQIRNTDGSFDSWIDDVWSNRNVRVYFGDVTWPRSKFQKIFDGVISDIDSKGRTSMSLKIRDKLELLNQPMSEQKLGGATDNKDRNLPMLFGECHNITPLLVDPATHTYMVHNGPINGIIEVRDNGLPVTFTENATLGTFSLSQSPSGTITCSAQGFATGGYTNNPVELVKRIVQNYGPAALRYTLADIDIANFNTYTAANDKPIGYFVADRANVLDVCQNITKSIGAQLTMSRLGLLTLCRLDASITTTTYDLNTSHMFDRSLQISQRLSAIAAEKVGFCKNWTVQGDLQTAVVEEHKALYAEEWLTETVSDSTVATLYKLDVDPAQRDTYLLVRNDANAEASRKLNLLKTPRNVYQFEGTRATLQLSLGQYVTLTANRFGLSTKRIGQVIGLSPDWMTGHVTVSVLVYGLAP